MKGTIADLTQMALNFRDTRDWKQFHTPKELAISLVVESAELLELMQWHQGQALAAQVKKKRADIADELGDVLHSILLLAAELDIDLANAFVEKLKKAAKKYPVEKSKGKATKYTELE